MSSASETRKYWYLDIRLDVRKYPPIDIDAFSKLFFSKAPKRANVFKFIMSKLMTKGSVELMKDLVSDIESQDFSVVPLNITWKQMFGGGLLKRDRRHEAVHVNTLFSERLVDIAVAWVKILSAKEFVDFNKECDKLIKRVENSKIALK